MLLTHETTIVLNKNDANIVGHMCYAAYKLWNVCNYERTNYKNLGLEKYPDCIIRSPSIKMICGSNHSRHRLHRKSASFWTSHGNLFTG